MPFQCVYYASDPGLCATLCAGPFDTQDACLASCGSGPGGGGGSLPPLPAPCCEGYTFGATICVEFNNVGNCPSWAGIKVPCIWDGTKWVSTSHTVNGSTFTLEIDIPDPYTSNCLTGIIHWTAGPCAGTTTNLGFDIDACSPISLTSNPFGATNFCGCDGGGATGTLTATITDSDCGGLTPPDAPCQGRDFHGSTAYFTDRTGGCTCLPDSMPVYAPTAGTDFGTYDSVADCESDTNYELSCVAGQYVLTSPQAVTITLLSFSAGPPTILSWEITGYGALCTTGGNARLTIVLP